MMIDDDRFQDFGFKKLPKWSKEAKASRWMHPAFPHTGHPRSLGEATEEQGESTRGLVDFGWGSGEPWSIMID